MAEEPRGVCGVVRELVNVASVLMGNIDERYFGEAISNIKGSNLSTLLKNSLHTNLMKVLRNITVKSQIFFDGLRMMYEWIGRIKWKNTRNC